jgi:NAD(P)-dependent dehydrogenase (short-subunit alcohol dehydrogenase family)
MQLEGINAVVYGAGGAVGAAVARAFANEGAKVFLTGRTRATVDDVAARISADGGSAETDRVDALDEAAVEEHLARLVESVGRIDVSFNAIGLPQKGIQGVPLTELSVRSFMLPVETYVRAHFITARAAARYMVPQGAGVILMHTPEPGRLGAPLIGGMGAAWAAMEGFNRCLSAECAPHGVRTICLRTTGLPETATIDVVFGLHARAAGVSPEEFRARVESMTHRRRSTTLRELTEVAVFVASDRAAAMTGAVVNLTGGITVD